MSESNTTLGAARGDIAAFSSNSDFTPTVIKYIQSSTTANSTTVAVKPEIIELAFKLNGAGIARGDIAAFSSNSDFTPTVIKHIQSSTTANSVTGTARSEFAEYSLAITSLSKFVGNTSATDWGGLAPQTPATYQTVEG